MDPKWSPFLLPVYILEIPMTKKPKKSSDLHSSSHSHAKNSSSNWLQVHRKRSLTLGRNSRIVYNRVPKCGSRTILDLFRRMKSHNKFSLKRSNKWHQFNLTQNSERHQATKILDLKKPIIFDRHMYFINFEK